MAELCAEMRMAMDDAKWHAGHLLVHMHHGYSMYGSCRERERARKARERERERERERA
jgi:hypothetical protein